MNVLPYEVKRAHWRGTWHAIRCFRARADEIREPKFWHMTPARFDILYIAWRADWQIHENRRARGMPPLERRIAMEELRDLLGLAGPTISRTAHRLDELDLVRIVPDETDGRRVVVVLTELGERMLRLAVECIRREKIGMRDCIVNYLSDGAFERLCDVEPAERTELDDRLGALVDESRRYARFFGCQAVPIYDPRFVMHLRPHTVSLLVWNIPGPTAHAAIMRLNQVLIEAAGPGDTPRGLLDSVTPLGEPSTTPLRPAEAPAQHSPAREEERPSLACPWEEAEPQPPREPGQLWRSEDLPVDRFPPPEPASTAIELPADYFGSPENPPKSDD